MANLLTASNMLFRWMPDEIIYFGEAVPVIQIISAKILKFK